MSWTDKTPNGLPDAALLEKARALDIFPLDSSNAALLDAVRPLSWKDGEGNDYDIIAIGAGAGGLVTAKQAARRGAKSAMISEHLAGGDCLNVGCVPSKALLHCAKVARDARLAAAEGILVSEQGDALPALTVDFGAVMARMRRLRAKIAPADSHDATAGAGADVYQGRGRFTGPNTLEVNGKTIRFKTACIATGGRARVPQQIPGLHDAPFVTNATLFNLTARPARMVILGAGAVGLEMAQAFANFGTKVTVLVRTALLAKEVADAGAAVQRALEADGVEFIFGAQVAKVETMRQASLDETGGLPLMRVHAGVGGGGASNAAVGTKRPLGGADTRILECEALLVATGRVPNVEDLGLESAGIKTGDDGILIDDLARTTNPSVYALGDCASGVPRFTHASGEMAKIVVQNALFGDTWKVSSLVIPRCVYTNPEVAGVGLTPSEAATKGLAVDVYRAALAHNDRAILEGSDDDGGFVEVLCEAGTERVVGGVVVAASAGDIVNELTVAIQHGVGLVALARVIHPYPTLGEGVMQAALNLVRKTWKRM